MAYASAGQQSFALGMAAVRTQLLRHFSVPGVEQSLQLCFQTSMQAVQITVSRVATMASVAAAHW